MNMATYGYKISNLTRAKKYAEIEALLDKKLVGFEKKGYAFEPDGSVNQDYVRTNEDGTQTKVTLSKNVTESSIVVFSDTELDFIKHGRYSLLMRDIIPTLIFAAVYWGIMAPIIIPYIYEIRNNITDFIFLLVISTIIMTAANLISWSRLAAVRSKARTHFIQCGGIISLGVFLWISTRIFAHYTLTNMLIKMLYTPLPVIFVSAAVTAVTVKFFWRE